MENDKKRWKHNWGHWNKMSPHHNTEYKKRSNKKDKARDKLGLEKLRIFGNQ